MNVVYTGSGPQALAIIANKHETFLHLNHLYNQGIGRALKHIISFDEIEDILQKEPGCEDCFEYLQGLFAKSNGSIYVKPLKTKESTSTTLSSSADMSIYFIAVRDGVNWIPPNTLSKPHQAIKLPKTRCSYQFETIAPSDPMLVKRECDITKQSLNPKKEKWVKVTIGLICNRKLLKQYLYHLLKKRILSVKLMKIFPIQ